MTCPVLPAKGSPLVLDTVALHVPPDQPQGTDALKDADAVPCFTASLSVPVRVTVAGTPQLTVPLTVACADALLTVPFALIVAPTGDGTGAPQAVGIPHGIVGAAALEQAAPRMPTTIINAVRERRMQPPLGPAEGCGADGGPDLWRLCRW